LSANEREKLTMNVHHQTSFKTVPVRRHDLHRAFTLTELLVVLATLGILAVVLLPALASNQSGSSKAFQCLNNMRQMAVAWTLYAADNQDKLAINSDPHAGSGPAILSWAAGVLDWTASVQNTNTAYLINDRVSLLGSYVGRSVGVFACPATATFLSPVQRSLGWPARCRSVAMDAAVGDGNKYEQPGNPFGWASWYVARKSTDFHTPAPGSIWVFGDEHPDSIDDCLMYTANYATTTITELPGSQHEGAGGVAFADGHSEIHKWQGVAARQPVQFTVKQQIACPFNDLDMLWLAQHTPQN